MGTVVYPCVGILFIGAVARSRGRRLKQSGRGRLAGAASGSSLRVGRWVCANKGWRLRLGPASLLGNEQPGG